MDRLPVDEFAQEKGGNGHDVLLPVHMVPGDVT